MYFFILVLFVVLGKPASPSWCGSSTTGLGRQLFVFSFCLFLSVSNLVECTMITAHVPTTLQQSCFSVYLYVFLFFKLCKSSYLNAEHSQINFINPVKTNISLAVSNICQNSALSFTSPIIPSIFFHLFFFFFSCNH